MLLPTAAGGDDLGQSLAELLSLVVGKLSEHSSAKKVLHVSVGKLNFTILSFMILSLVILSFMLWVGAGYPSGGRCLDGLLGIFDWYGAPGSEVLLQSFLPVIFFPLWNAAAASSKPSP